MSRRRQFSAAIQAERKDQPKTVRQGVGRAIELEIAIESALKGGFCPNCGVRIGRTVRTHFETCGIGGGREQSGQHGPKDPD